MYTFNRIAEVFQDAKFVPVLDRRASVRAGFVVNPATLAQTKAAPAVASHDLTGMWEFFQTLPGQGVYATTSKQPPPMTPWARKRFAAARPGYGPKAVIADGNDPILHCDPTQEFHACCFSRNRLRLSRPVSGCLCSSGTRSHVAPNLVEPENASCGP